MKELVHLLFEVFRFFLLTLSCFRLVRIVTTDDLTEPFRDWVDNRFGPKSNWSKLVSCMWCAGLYVIAAVYLFDFYVWRIPTPLLMFGATLAIVGYLGNYDD